MPARIADRPFRRWTPWRARGPIQLSCRWALRRVGSGRIPVVGCEDVQGLASALDRCECDCPDVGVHVLDGDDAKRAVILRLNEDGLPRLEPRAPHSGRERYHVAVANPTNLDQCHAALTYVYTSIYMRHPRSTVTYFVSEIRQADLAVSRQYCPALLRVAQFPTNPQRHLEAHRGRLPFRESGPRPLSISVSSGPARRERIARELLGRHQRLLEG